MPYASTRPAEVVIPAACIAALRESLTEQIGPDAAARALQRAGHAAGDAFHALLAAEADDATGASMREDLFWRRLGEMFASRGWGRLDHDRPHPGVGSLASGDWAESDPAGGGERPSCFFTTGLLANLLGHVAGREVGVFEIECRSAGDDRCHFLFGGTQALRGVYESLLQGSSSGEALARLG